MMRHRESNFRLRGRDREDQQFPENGSVGIGVAVDRTNQDSQSSPCGTAAAFSPACRVGPFPPV
jgi:hypothetical protein